MFTVTVAADLPAGTVTTPLPYQLKLTELRKSTVMSRAAGAEEATVTLNEPVDLTE